MHRRDRANPWCSQPTTCSAASMTNQRCPVNLRVLVFQIIIRLGLRSLFTREWDSVPRDCRGSVHRVNTPLERRTDVHPLSCGAHNHAHARASVHRCSERLIDVDHITQRLVLQERWGTITRAGVSVTNRFCHASHRKLRSAECARKHMEKHLVIIHIDGVGHMPVARVPCPLLHSDASYCVSATILRCDPLWKCQIQPKVHKQSCKQGLFSN